MTQPEIHLIGGPTASGKSALALKMATNLNGVVINADAMQIYQGLSILTAQPSFEDKSRILHLLYEVLPPTAPSSVGKWLDMAEKAIRNTLEQGKTPIVTGGTGLYFKALTDGLAAIPSISPSDHQTVAAQYDKLGSEAFRSLLVKLDPESASKIKPNDRQRLIRAYEVALFTGHPLAFWQKESQPSQLIRELKITRHLIVPEREALYATCDKRFLRMMELGAADEVRSLLALQINPDYPAMKILGVPELAAFIRGEITQGEAISRAQQFTRNYAKRQMTWFRHQWQNPTIHT